ncbi:MAG: SIMPL domain-containing protein [Saprospiraceae bacterium]|nr:SIMPL domain-containing protein [Saprospiraceae bacterium]
MGKTKPYISVEGIGVVTAPADKITLSFSIQELHKQYKDCLDGLALRVQQLKADIVGCGFAGDQLKTGHFSVNPEYDYHEGQQLFRGYRAAQNLTIDMPMDKARLSEVLATLSRSESKAEFNLQFGLKDDKPLRLQALAAAVATARENATALAAAASVQLGAMQSILFTPTQVTIGGGLDVHMMAMKSAAPLEIDPADLRYEVKVVLEWVLGAG